MVASAVGPAMIDRFWESVRDGDVACVPFGARMVQLSGPASQEFKLQGNGQQVIAWEPGGSEAFELEVRARLLGNSGADEDIPVIRFSVEASAGNHVWSEPPEERQGTARYRDFTVPARGMAFRVGARQFRITFFVVGNTSGTAFVNSSLRVTILPVYSSLVDVYPYGASNQPQENSVNVFPMTAREWRLQDQFGRPFAAAAQTVALLGVNGIVFGLGLDAEEYAEWQPIPFDAAAWAGSTAAMYAAYR